MTDSARTCQASTKLGEPCKNVAHDTYTAQVQSKQAIDAAVERLARLPGGDTLLVVKSQIESTSPRDLLDFDTWVGAWVILNAAVQAQAIGKRRVLGEKDDQDD